MKVSELRQLLKKYYKAQGGIRQKPRAVAANPVPGISFDILIVAIFLVLCVSYIF